MKINNKTIKIFLCLFLFGIVMYGSIWCLDRVLCVKTEHGILQARNMYDQPKNSVDVVFMGSSHIHCDVNTALLWEQYGIAAYDYSAAEQPLWVTYFYLKEICKYQNPKLVVLDLYSPARFKEDYQYDWLYDNLAGVKFSLNKLKMLYVSCEPEYYFDYFPSIGAYHNRYAEVTEEDYEYLFSKRIERQVNKGFTQDFQTRPQSEPEITQKKSGGITVKSEQYLQKIIEFAQDNDIDLFLIVSPYITTQEDELVYNRVHEIADQYGLQFNSTNYFYSEMDLNFDKDFFDESHLNYAGSIKFTEYLGKELKEKYDLPDRRGLEKWKSWDLHVDEIRQLSGDV